MMAWGPPTTKEEVKQTLDALSKELSILIRSVTYDRLRNISIIIGTLRSQVDHIPWEEVDHDNP